MNIARLKNLISASPLTNEQIAKKCGIAPATLYNILNGADMKVSTLEALSSALGVSPGRLFDDSSEIEAPGSVSDLTLFMGPGPNEKATVKVMVEVELDREELARSGLKDKVIRALNR